MPALYETLRPKSWAEVVGQDEALKRIEAIRQRNGGLNGRAWWISGKSGVGKSTIAALIAAEVADDWQIIKLRDPSELTADELRDAAKMQRYRAMGKGCCWILDEAHGLRQDQVRKLLGLLEGMPSWCTWIFTTTNAGQQSLFEDCDDAGPLLSRCDRLALVAPEYAFAQSLLKIARANGLDGQDISAYCKLIAKHECNKRAALMEIEAGCMKKHR